MRVVIAGFPKSGKTMFALKLGMGQEYSPVTTDSFMELPWSDQSDEVAKLFDQPRFIVEGMSAPRALRKWLRKNPEGKPCDRVYWLDTTHQPLDKGQERMGKGAKTVLEEIADELERRGVEIIVEGEE